MSKPKSSSRPYMPGYGIEADTAEQDLLPWSYVEEHMLAAHNYWVATASLQGEPHTVPVWGIWYQGAFYFSTGANTRKGHNLAENPHLVVHLESGDETIILEGRARLAMEEPLFSKLSDTYYTKYQVRFSGEDPVYKLQPTKAFAWIEKDFPNTATRWQFDEE